MQKATIDELRKILFYIMRGYKVPEIIYDVIYKVAKKEVEDKKRVVLIKRDPNIHRDRIQAAYVKIISGETIEIHPGIVGGFGADFDGDQMAVFVPLSKQAQKEAKEKLISVFTSNKLFSSNYKLTNEMLLGLHSATFGVSDNYPVKITDPLELKKLHPSTRVSYVYKRTSVSTAGRYLFNLCLPEWYEFVDKYIDKKVASKILSDVLKTNQNDFTKTFDCLMRFSFEYATRYPKTISLDLLGSLPRSIIKLKENLMKEKSVDKQYKIIEEMEKQLIEYLKTKEPDLYAYIVSGAAKGITQLRQLMVAKGLFTDPEGKVLPPVATSLTEGYNTREYFNASSAARRGTINRVHTTSKGGYSYRKMLYVMSNTLASRSLRDCETRLFLKVKLTKDLFSKMSGRYVQNGPAGKLLPVTEDMIGKVISLRSPVYCKSMEICHICYGELLKQIKTTEVGLLAAQECTSLSEKIMKAFHTGGALTMSFLDFNKCLKENLETNYEYIIDSYFDQKDDELSCKTPVIIYVNKAIFDKEKYKKTTDILYLPVGYFKILIKELNTTINVTIEQPVEVYLKNSKALIEDDNEIAIEYEKNSVIVRVPSQSLTPEKVASMIDSYVGGKSPWSTPESLFMKFYKILSPFSDWDSVHLETIIGTILRWKKDPRYPARVKYPYEPIMFSIKTLPSIISWPLGLAYEDFTKSISFGLISEKGYTGNLERVLFGESLVQ